MCSIGGFISSEPLKPAVALRLARGLVYFGESRGSQSSGLFTNSTLVKKATSPFEFIYSKEFESAMAVPTKCVLTHTRQPTSGGRGDDQAHPFWVGNTITTHNGWLNNCKELRTKWDLEKPSGVDSELLAAALHKYGTEKFHEVVATMEGTAALAALHEGRLLLGRDGNPMEYYKIDVENGSKPPIKLMVFASSMMQVMGAIQHQWLIKRDTTTTLPQEKLFEVDPDSLELKEISPFSVHQWQSTYHGTSDHEGYGYGSRGNFPYGGGNENWRSRTPSPSPEPAKSTLFLPRNAGRAEYPDHRRDAELINSVLKNLKEDQRVCLFGFHFTVTEIKEILTDSSVIPPRHKNDWGFKYETKEKGMVRIYNARYAAMQKVKYPSMTKMGGGKDRKTSFSLVVTKPDTTT